MKIYKYTVGPMGTNCYLAVDEATKEAVLVDPGEDADRLKEAIADKGCRVAAILLTHAHFDHILALEPLRGFTGAPLLLHEKEAPFLTDGDLNLTARFSDRSVSFRPAEKTLSDGDVIPVGNASLSVLHTPGHTPGSVCYLDREDGNLLCGDTLFREGIGRYDLPGGRYPDLIASLQRLKALADGETDYRVLPGHGASSRLSHELSFNPYLL